MKQALVSILQPPCPARGEFVEHTARRLPSRRRVRANTPRATRTAHPEARSLRQRPGMATPTTTSTPAKPSDGPRFVANGRADGPPLVHHWQFAVGGPHAAFALRADVQQQLARCRRDLGMLRMRCHHWLGREMGAVVCQDNKLRFSFVNAERIIDFMSLIGMEPLIELSFMPEALASGHKTAFHYRANVTPPKEMADWTETVSRLTTHLRDRYGARTTQGWHFEVWNEPNLAAFWPGTMHDYFQFYARTAETVKSVHPGMLVGGPVSAKSQWLDEFTSFCQGRAPLDFVSTHQYPTDALGGESTNTLEELAKAPRFIMRDQARAARRSVGSTQLYYTEWNVTSNPHDTLHDQAYAAAYAARTALEWTGIVDGSSYWTFTDLFAENYFPSAPFHGGFGLQTIHGIAKPVYRAFQLLRELSDQLVQVEGDHPNVSCFVTRGRRRVDVLLVNLFPPFADLHTERVTVRLERLGTPRRQRLRRIDDEHVNPLRVWHEMGRPESLNERELTRLHDASTLVEEPLAVHVEGDVMELEVVMPPNALALVTLEVDAPEAATLDASTPDDALIERSQRDLYSYFESYTDPRGGLTADSSKASDKMSIAATGLNLSCLPLATERGYMSRSRALHVAASAARTLLHGEQSKSDHATGYRGFLYHYLDPSGRRIEDCELSTIDTAIAIAGLLTAAAYFDSDRPSERSFRDDVAAITERVEWTWALDGEGALRHGWHPHRGFLPYAWRGYSEALLLYVLALGAEAHPIPPESYRTFTSGYRFGEVEGLKLLTAGPLFIHQLPQIWLDLREMADEALRGAGTTYFENSRAATLAQSRYAARNPGQYRDYAADSWGFTACEGPGPAEFEVDGRPRRFLGYAARGVPDGPDDGTIAPWGALTSLPFAPELVLKTLRRFERTLAHTAHGFPTTVNPTFERGGPAGWISPSHFALNQGPAVLMLENHRTGLVWQLMRSVPIIRRGLERAGFRGGWLGQQDSPRSA